MYLCGYGYERQKLKLGAFIDHAPSYVSRQGLSLNLELTDSLRLAGQ